MPELKERIVGGFLGVAVGDALGFPVETQDRETLRMDPVTDMREGGIHRQVAGTWSENTSLALCLTESLLAGFSVQDQATRFCQWYLEGKWTPHGDTFDAGPTISRAIERIAAGVPLSEAGSDDEPYDDNGSLMRILPIALWGRDLPVDALLERTHDASSITHPHPRALMACGLHVLYAVSLLQGRSAAEALAHLRENVPLMYSDWSGWSLPYPRQMHHFERLLAPGFENLPEAEIQSDEDAVHTLEAGVWCLLHGKSFEDTVLRAVNLGGDTNVTAAVTGGLAGALYGETSIPRRWIRRLARANEIVALARKFTATGAPA